jgi:hypothetical protein
MAQIEIVIDGVLLDKLSEGFFWEEYVNRPRRDGGAMELIIARVNGLSIKILADEHPPPHFHVSYQGQDASFSIVDCSRLPGVKGLERYEGRIRNWWYENRHLLVERWNASRPTDCPVGAISLSG